MIDARLEPANDLTLNTARLCLYRVDLAEGKLDGLVEQVTEVLEFFHKRYHYYDEALAAMLLAEVHFALNQNKEIRSSNANCARPFSTL